MKTQLNSINNSENRVSFNMHIVYLLFLVIPIIEPKIFTQFSFLHLLFVGLNIIEFIYLLVKTIFSRGTISKVFVGWILYRFYVLFISLFSDNFYYLQWGYLTLMICNLILLFDMCRYNGEVQKLVYSISIICLLFIFINLITLLVLPRGIIKSTFFDIKDNDWYFLGIKTHFTTMMFPAFATSYISYLNKNKFSKFILLSTVIFCVATIFIKMITTAIIGLLILIILLLSYKITKKSIGYKIWILIILALQISVVFFGLQEHLNQFFMIFSKDASMSSRTEIWESATKTIFGANLFNVLFGNGFEASFVLYDGRLINAHNQFLATIYYVGFFGLIAFLYFLYYLQKNCDVHNKGYNVLMCLIISFFVMTITEEYFEFSYCFIPFMLFYYAIPQKNIYGVNYESQYIYSKL